LYQCHLCVHTLVYILYFDEQANKVICPILFSEAEAKPLDYKTELETKSLDTARLIQD
jgi:hypothetical protein